MKSEDALRGALKPLIVKLIPETFEKPVKFTAEPLKVQAPVNPTKVLQDNVFTVKLEAKLMIMKVGTISVEGVRVIVRDSAAPYILLAKA